MIRLLFVALLLFLLCPQISLAHDVFGISALSGGLLHPILGPDHLLAMIAVGIISAKIGGHSIWAVPSTFVISLIFGSYAGMNHIDFPLLEEGIALSVLLLGSGIFIRGQKNNPLLTYVVVGIFGLYHGNSHGREFLSGSMPGLYTIGFVISTIGLHLIGVFTGKIWRLNPNAKKLFRSGGIVIAVIGLIFLTDIVYRNFKG
jgi:urease accessory protein